MTLHQKLTPKAAAQNGTACWSHDPETPGDHNPGRLILLQGFNGSDELCWQL